MNNIKGDQEYRIEAAKHFKDLSGRLAIGCFLVAFFEDKDYSAIIGILAFSLSLFLLRRAR